MCPHPSWRNTAKSLAARIWERRAAGQCAAALWPNSRETKTFLSHRLRNGAEALPLRLLRDLFLENDGRQLFSKLATALVSFHHRGGQIQNPLGGLLCAHTTRMDVRDEIAIGIGVGCFRL